MRIALAQTNPTVGDIAGNTEKVLACIEAAAERGAELVVLPELAVIGYPPKDLLLKPDVIGRCERAVERIAARCTDVAAIVGYPAGNEAETGRALHNAAAVCRNGRVVHRHVKHLLPSYDVFDETRYFEPGPPVDLTELWDVRLGISVCEDLWNDEVTEFSRRLYHDNPIEDLAAKGAQLFINTSASPFAVRKPGFRRKLLAHTAKAHRLPIVYVNQAGGNDELIFDGNSCVMGPDGEELAHAADFEEDLLVVDVPVNGETDRARPSPRSSPGAPRTAQRETRNAKRETQETKRDTRHGVASVYAALELGLRDYCRKCGFSSLVLGLSGGIDSAVSACIAAAAMGPANVTGVTMPSRHSSEGSQSDSRQLADRLGIHFREVSLEAPHAEMESLLTEQFAGDLGEITAQNIQARLRGVILMAFSNQLGAMLVSTGNKSELAVGYCTLYGDMAGGLAVLSDVPKRMVYELAAWINTPDCPLRERCAGPPIPESTIEKPPSAELAPDQTDQDTLPDYAVLDPIVERYVERHHSAARIAEETGIDERTVLQVVTRIDRNEYKRKQAAPGLKITGRAFGFGRRMPIAQGYDPSGPDNGGNREDAKSAKDE